MSEPTPLERIAAALPQALFDHDRSSHGQAPYPLSQTILHRDDYAAQGARVMAVIGPLLAAEAAYLWPALPCPTACPPLPFTGGACASPEPLPHRCYGACGVHTKASEAVDG